MSAAKEIKFCARRFPTIRLPDAKSIKEILLMPLIVAYWRKAAVLARTS